LLTPADVRNTKFTVTRRRPGYDQKDVDDFLDRTEAELSRLVLENHELTGAKHGGAIPLVRPHPSPLTPADVRNTKFTVTRHRPGYDQREVDTFLNRTEAELDRLIRENEELRAQLTGNQFTGDQYPRLPGPDSGPGPGPGKARATASGPGCLFVLALFFAAVAIGAGVGFAAFHAAYERSNHTQASGIPDSATVTSVSVGTGKAAETKLTVRLGTAVGGQDVSVVNIAGGHSYQRGEKVSILVDPQDPSYSELPGLPDGTALESLVATAIVILLTTPAAVASLAGAFRTLRKRRRGRRSLPTAISRKPLSGIHDPRQLGPGPIRTTGPSNRVPYLIRTQTGLPDVTLIRLRPHQCHID
jgi:DivIVA domain-containing protein